MATKIRLARHGRKKKPFYHIVVADSRAPRDGRFIEKLGSYNPNTNPAAVTLDFESAVNWIEKGAQPTDTTRAILSYEGALMRVHLNKGVVKGAMTQEQADAKFDAWKAEKATLIEKKVAGLEDAKASKAKASMEAETAKRQSIQERVDAKLAPPVEETAEEVVEAVEAVSEDAPAEEVVAETPTTEEAAPEVVEAAPEVVAEEKAEETAPEAEETAEGEEKKA